jgi:hypothetical protein
MARGRATGRDHRYAEERLALALFGVQAYVIHPAVREADVVAVLDVLPDDSGENARIESIKVDLEDSVKYLEGAALKEAFAHVVGADVKKDGDKFGFPHPNPLDRKKTAEILIRSAAEGIEDVRRGWPKRRDVTPMAEIETELPITSEWWKSSLPGIPDLHGQQSHPLQNAAKRREFWTQVEALDNPIGRMTAAHFLWQGTASAEEALEFKINYVGTRATCAISLYKLKFGRHPATLQELVDKGILESVPIDPASGKAFGYNASRRKLWSIGADGVDDQGMNQGGLRRKPDFVFVLR